MASIAARSRAARRSVGGEDVLRRSIPRRARRVLVSPWTRRYVWLVIAAVVVLVYVGLLALASELGTLEWKLRREVEAQRNLQAAIVREINWRARWANLEGIIRERHLVRQPAGVIEIRPPKPLPSERLTVLTTPQPFRRPMGTGRQRPLPAQAGMR